MSSVPWPGPRRSIEQLAARHGRDVVVSACRDLLAGREVAADLLVGLGGPPARWAVHGGRPGPDYWLRVWALRGLLWLWDDAAEPAVRGALGDPAWRVREMALKVLARHRLDGQLEEVLLLRADPVARVRAAADRAVACLHG